MKYNLLSKGRSNNVLMLAVLACTTIALISCGKKDPNSPGVEYMPDMYRSEAYEPYAEKTFNGDTVMTSRLPVAGTIARGQDLYPYENTPEDYEAAGAELKNPIALSDEVLAEGEVLYGKYCAQCHGKSGNGDGKVGGKLPGPPPAYSSLAANVTEGKMFHTLTYGKGLMGSHASQLSKEERWKLVHYVQKLRFPEGTASAE